MHLPSQSRPVMYLSHCNVLTFLYMRLVARYLYHFSTENTLHFSLTDPETFFGNEVWRVSGTREAFESEVGQLFKSISKVKPKTDFCFIVSTSKTNKNASSTFQLILEKI